MGGGPGVTWLTLCWLCHLPVIFNKSLKKSLDLSFLFYNKGII